MLIERKRVITRVGSGPDGSRGPFILVTIVRVTIFNIMYMCTLFVSLVTRLKVCRTSKTSIRRCGPKTLPGTQDAPTQGDVS